MSRLLLFLCVLALVTLNILAQNNAPLLLTRVTHNQKLIAFATAGKIWVVDKNGGTARRLTKTTNEESDPVISPDGNLIAFSQSNGDDLDIFVTDPEEESEPRRITMMPVDDYPVSWSPDSKSLIFATTRDEGTLFRLYQIEVRNPTIAKSLPLPQSLDGTLSPDGKFIAYNPRQYIFGEWSYYRGGATAPIWITNLQTGSTEKLTTQNSNDKNPMWIKNRIYFLSDRTGIFNLFSFDRQTRQTKQLTKFEGQGIRSAYADNEAISFIQNGQIHLFDPASNQDKIINISVSLEKSEIAPRNVKAMQFLDNASSFADGKKLLLNARGEVLIFDVASGAYKNLTNTSNAAERYPVVSPDNKNVAYFSDETGEYQLFIRSLENNEVKKIIIESNPSFYKSPVWSPDSRKLVFCDRRLNLWLADVSTGRTVNRYFNLFSPK